MPHVRRFDHVGLTVEDLDGVTDFFVGLGLEVARFVRPDSVPGSSDAMANELGLRNVSFEVGDLQAAVDWAAAEGYGLVGGIGEYQGAVRMAYVRGPEGIIVSLFEQLA